MAVEALAPDMDAAAGERRRVGGGGGGADRGEGQAHLKEDGADGLAVHEQGHLGLPTVAAAAAAAAAATAEPAAAAAGAVALV